jgi:outer membrane protein TolC
MKTAWIVMLCSALFCGVAMAQQPKQTAPQSSPAQSVSAQATAGQVLTLDEVVKLALEHSPDLALARVQYTAAKNAAGVDRANFLPNLYTGSGAAYTNGFPQTPGGGAPAVFEMSYQEALFNKPLRGALHFDEEIAKNKELDYQNARENVIVNAAASYLEFSNVERSLQLLQGEQASAQQILDLTQQREAAGLELPVSVTQDELRVARVQQRIIQYQDREQVLTTSLRNMTGLPATQPLQISLDTTLASEPSEPASNVVAEVVSHSSGLKEAENYRLARQDLLKGAKGAYWPTIDIIGEYSVLSKINNYQEFFAKFQRNNVNVGIQVTVPIFAAKTSADVAVAKSNFAEASLELAAAKNAVAQGAEQQEQAVREADAARKVAQLDLQLAQQQLQELEADFNQNQSHVTLSQLEQARLEENEKWLAFLDAGLSHERAELNLLQATGQLAKLFQ